MPEKLKTVRYWEASKFGDNMFWFAQWDWRADEAYALENRLGKRLEHDLELESISGAT